VGIGGAPSGSFKFEVTGTSRFTGALTGTSATFSGNIAIGTNPASAATGAVVRLPYDNAIRWRNSSNTADVGFYVGTSNLFYFDAGINVGGAIISGMGNNSQIFRSTNGTTGYMYGTISNSGGNLTLGIDQSTGGALANGSLGYAAIFGNAASAPTQIAANNFVGITLLPNLNVGLGTNSPAVNLHISSSADTGIRLASSAGAYSTYLEMYGAGGGGAAIKAIGAGIPMIFETGGNQRMQITSGGRVLIGTSTDANFQLHVNLAAYIKQCVAFGLSIDDRYIGQGNQISGAFGAADLSLANYAASGRVTITNGSTGVVLNNGSTSFSSFSDERLKNINNGIEKALDKLSAIRAVNFSWKSDKEEKENLGLIAQDVQKVFPQIIDKSRSFDETDDTEYLTIRYTELIPVLVKAIQEQQGIIESQEQRIAYLENK
jgi:hypothetical protein